MLMSIRLPQSRKAQKTMVILRALYKAKPGEEKRAIRKALRKLKKKGKAA